MCFKRLSALKTVFPQRGPNLSNCSLNCFASGLKCSSKGGLHLLRASPAWLHLVGFTWGAGLHLVGFTWWASPGGLHLVGFTGVGFTWGAGLHLVGFTWVASLVWLHLVGFTWVASPGGLHRCRLHLVSFTGVGFTWWASPVWASQGWASQGWASLGWLRLRGFTCGWASQVGGLHPVASPGSPGWLHLGCFTWVASPGWLRGFTW